MSDIVISYAREDQVKAEVIANALERQGWSVWWDTNIPTGQEFNQVIQQELNAAKCIVVLWSSNSIQSGWVRDEAEEGKMRGILVPILIEDVKVPLGFRQIQTARLLDWQGAPTHLDFQRLINDIEAVLTSTPTRNGVLPQTQPRRFKTSFVKEPLYFRGVIVRSLGAIFLTGCATIGGSLMFYGILKFLIRSEYIVPDSLDLLIPLICVWVGLCFILGIWVYKQGAKS